MKETLEHQNSFEIYLRLGPRRTYQKVADIIGGTKATVARWGKRQDWPQRVKDRQKEQAVEAAAPFVHVISDPAPTPTPGPDPLGVAPIPPPTSTAIATANPETAHVEKLMSRVSLLLNSCFEEVDGIGIVATFEVKSTADFVKLVQTQKDLILLQRELLKADKPGLKHGLNKLADTLNIYTKGMTDAEKLSLLTGDTSIADAATTSGGAEGIQEADFEEVSDGADQGEN